MQEIFNKAELHGVPAEPAHGFSTVAASFSRGVVGGVYNRQWSCTGRPGAKRDPRDWPRRLFSGHARLLNQDNSPVEPPKSAENTKKKDTKQYQQVVTSCSLMLVISLCVLRLFSCVSCWDLVFQLSDRARERKVPVTRIGRLVNFGGECVHRFQWGQRVCFFPLCERIDSFCRSGDWTRHRRDCWGGKEEF